MSLRERTAVDDVLEARERFVARGVATPRLVVTRAEGAQVEAADGTLYLDFAGGIACQNTGHGFAPVVAAIHEQVDRFLHQCFMVGTYEPYVEVCRRLAEHSPCTGERQKSILVNSGAEAIENAVKIARAATGRPAVVVFENGFHGRTLLTMAMTSKVRPYKAGFGPFPGEVYRAAAPYPYRGVDTDAAIASLEHLFKSEVEAETVACVVLETVQGEGGFIPMPGDYLARLRELCDAHGILFVADEVQSGVGRTGPMWAIEHSGVADDVLEARERFVARGVATPRLVVVRAEGAQVEAADGTVYLDFAGGIACQNTGHGFAPVVAAIHEQVDRFLHQCFMVGTYEPYVEVCRRLAEHSPCAGERQKSILVNSGAEAIENAVKIARAATGRPAVVVFENGFHGRTLLTMAMTSKVRPYKAGFGPFPGEVYRAAAPYPYRGIDTDAAIASLEHLFKSEVEAETVACVVLETVQGEGGFIPMPGDYLARLRELCDAHGILFVADEVQSGVGRTGPMWAIEHSGVAPDLLVSGKSLGGGLPLAAVTGRAEVMDAPGPGGLGGTFGGNPVACAAAAVVLDTIAEPEFRARADALGADAPGAARRARRRGTTAIGEVRGLGPMLALELREQSPDLAQKVTAAAFERGLLLLSCGLYGNVLRLLPPLTVTDEELARGLQLLEESLAAAG